jgi:ribonuclease J
MSETYRPNPDDLVFLPLGGTDEIGMNLSLYHYAGKWLMVDLGITFGDDATPGLDIILPDPSYAESIRHDIVGLVVTHGHEDHIGAIPYLWPRLRCSIYATPFTASLVRRKLADAGLLDQVDLVEVSLKDNFVIGPFEIELITLTHSIPEPSAVVIRCGGGTVLHTGDWKLDPRPVIGEVTDMDAIRRVAAEGVLAMVGDSTNVFVEGEAGSETAIRDSMTELFGEIDARIAVTCFSSNVARLHSIALAAAANGRHAALIGRSLWRMLEAARENGYLHDIPDFISERDAGFLPRDKVVMVVTGSQGEPRAALARIAENTHPEIVLEAGDTVIFSAREIPGNEKPIGRIQSRLAQRGVRIITADDRFVHVSGHPARNELTQMYQAVRPAIAIPVHGTPRHLIEHAKLARACQVPEVVVPANGSAIRLAAGRAGVVGQVPTGALTLDGDRIRRVDSAVIRDRRKMLYNGTGAVTVVLDGKGRMAAEPIVSLSGVYDETERDDAAGEASELVRGAVLALQPGRRGDDEAVREVAMKAVRKLVRGDIGKRPLVSVHVVRL